MGIEPRGRAHRPYDTSISKGPPQAACVLPAQRACRAAKGPSCTTGPTSLQFKQRARYFSRFFCPKSHTHTGKPEWSHVALSNAPRLVIVHHLLCWAIPSGSLLVRSYPYIGGRYMGNKYHVLHRHLSRLSRRDDLGLGVAVTSIHPAAEKKSSRKSGFRHTEFLETQLVLLLLILVDPICRGNPTRSGPGLHTRISSKTSSRKPRGHKKGRRCWTPALLI